MVGEGRKTMNVGDPSVQTLCAQVAHCRTGVDLIEKVSGPPSVSPTS